MSTPSSPGRPGPLAALALTAGPRSGQELPVERPVVTVGRATGCDLVIDDDSVSAAHARLEWDGGHWRITDLGSVNGTALDGVKLPPETPTPLSYGSTVRLGGVKLQFHEVTGADPDAARAEYVAPAPQRTLREERRGGGFPLWLALVVLLLLAIAGYLLTSGTLRVGAAQPGALPALAVASYP
jgi:pSer/pThr/pTyr-binding forkhead associated (FHA) protein